MSAAWLWLVVVAAGVEPEAPAVAPTQAAQPAPPAEVPPVVDTQADPVDLEPAPAGGAAEAAPAVPEPVVEEAVPVELEPPAQAVPPRAGPGSEIDALNSDLQGVPRRRAARWRVRDTSWRPLRRAMPPPMAPAVPAPAAPVEVALPQVAAWLPARGFLAGVGLLVMAAAWFGLSVVMRRSRERLRPRGVLPSMARITQSFSRLAAGTSGALAVAAVLPETLLPVALVGLVTLGVVVGWSLRHLVRDVVSGAILVAEGRPRAGALVTVDGVRGVVERVGWRVTWVRDELGKRLAVPNHALLNGSVAVEETRFPRVEVDLDIPWSGPTEVVRERLAEAALVSPWRAPSERPVVTHLDGRARWQVAVRVVDLKFAAAHEQMVRAVAFEALGLDTPPLP